MGLARVPGPLLQAIAAVTASLREADVPAAVIGGVSSSPKPHASSCSGTTRAASRSICLWRGCRSSEKSSNARRDVADIEALLDTHPQLDLERIRSLLRSFTEALEADDFAAEFERLLAHRRRRR